MAIYKVSVCRLVSMTMTEVAEVEFEADDEAQARGVAEILLEDDWSGFHWVPDDDAMHRMAEVEAVEELPEPFATRVHESDESDEWDEEDGWDEEEEANAPYDEQRAERS